MKGSSANTIIEGKCRGYYGSEYILFYCLENDGQPLEPWIGKSAGYTSLVSFSVV